MSFVTSTKRGFGRNPTTDYQMYPFLDSTKLLDFITTQGYNSETVTYYRNLTRNGGTISTSALALVDTFVTTLKAGGVFTKLYDAGIFVGDNLQAAVTKIRYLDGVSPYVLAQNFTQADYTQATGMKGDGSTKYIDTQLKVSRFTSGNTSMSTYVRDNTAASVMMGAFNDSLSTRFSVHAFFADNNSYSDQYNFTGGRTNVASGTPGAGWGLFCASRLPTPTHKIFRNSTELVSSTGTGGTLANLNDLSLYVMAANNSNGTPATFSSRYESFYHFGEGLTNAEVTVLYNAVQALQLGLGRQV